MSKSARNTPSTSDVARSPLRDTQSTVAQSEIEVPFVYSPKRGATGTSIKAIDAARFLIQLAAAEEEPDYLTHLRLQKLLYFAQGWSLAMRNKPLFKERIEAWANGPVVPEVYHEFKGNGDRPIDPDQTPTAQMLSDDEREFLESLWHGYKKYSASSLREMTHKHATWIAARKGLAPGEACNREITQSVMKSFFKKQLLQ